MVIWNELFSIKGFSCSTSKPTWKSVADSVFEIEVKSHEI